jgi:hypothetical protein
MLLHHSNQTLFSTSSLKLREGTSFMELHFQQHLVDWNLMKVAHAISVSDAKLIPN